MSVPYIAPSMLAKIIPGDAFPTPPRDVEGDRARIAAKLASPKRESKRIEAVEDAAHLPLFVAANEPKFI